MPCRVERAVGRPRLVPGSRILPAEPAHSQHDVSIVRRKRSVHLHVRSHASWQLANTLSPAVMASDSPTYLFPYSLAAQLDSRIKTPRPPIDPGLAPIIDSVLLPEELDV